MYISTEALVESLEEWIREIKARDFAAARSHAEHLPLCGTLIAIHPEFRRRFAYLEPNTDPAYALKVMSEFLVCATECRSEAVASR